MLSIFFDHAFDSFTAFGMYKRALTSFASSVVVFSYLHHCEMYVIIFDKLLRVLTASESRIWLLSDMEEWLMLLEPPIASFSYA